MEELLPLVRISTELLPGFRARALYNSNITTPQAIMCAKKEVLVNILKDIIPYESEKPMYRNKTDGKSTSTWNQRSSGMDVDGDQEKRACEGLATRARALLTLSHFLRAKGSWKGRALSSRLCRACHRCASEECALLTHLSCL